MEKEKSAAKLLQEKLCVQRKNGVLRTSEEDMKLCDEYCESYKSFMDTAKIEREAVEFAEAAAIKAGYHTEPAEREHLVREVLTRDDIRCCPHGRPVCISLTKKQLEKQFKRT